MFAGINNELLKAVLDAFYLRFTPKGRVLWVSEADDPVLAARDELHQLGVSLLRPRSLPTVVINDAQSFVTSQETPTEQPQKQPHNTHAKRPTTKLLPLTANSNSQPA